jgi:hypothetical protein
MPEPAAAVRFKAAGFAFPDGPPAMPEQQNGARPDVLIVPGRLALSCRIYLADVIDGAVAGRAAIATMAHWPIAWPGTRLVTDFLIHNSLFEIAV